MCESALFTTILAALDAYDIRHQSQTDPARNLAVSLVHFTTFFQGKDKSLEHGDNHYKSGHVESFSYASKAMVGGSECVMR